MNFANGEESPEDSETLPASLCIVIFAAKAAHCQARNRRAKRAIESPGVTTERSEHNKKLRQDVSQ